MADVPGGSGPSFSPGADRVHDADSRPHALAAVAQSRKLTMYKCSLVKIDGLIGTTVRSLCLDYRPAYAGILRQMSRLQDINGLPVQEFWKRNPQHAPEASPFANIS